MVGASVAMWVVDLVDMTAVELVEMSVDLTELWKVVQLAVTMVALWVALTAYQTECRKVDQ